MKYLLLMRHGKAVKSEESPDDFSRELHSKGIAEVRDNAIKLHGKNYLPDVIMSSTALRAVQTAELVSEIIHIPQFIRVDELYQAEIKTIYSLLKNQDNERSIMIVGHNPNMEDTASACLGREVSMSTSHIIVIETEIDSWHNFSKETKTRMIEEFIP